MKSVLGALLAVLYALAFGVAYFKYASASGQWPEAQWLFLVALPYTLTMLRLVGSVDFSGESLASVATAATFCCALAYLAGALVEAIWRAGFGWARRFIRQA
jgi:hypothetical protein